MSGVEMGLNLLCDIFFIFLFFSKRKTHTHFFCPQKKSSVNIIHYFFLFLLKKIMSKEFIFLYTDQYGDYYVNVSEEDFSFHLPTKIMYSIMITPPEGNKRCVTCYGSTDQSKIMEIDDLICKIQNKISDSVEYNNNVSFVYDAKENQFTFYQNAKIHTKIYNLDLVIPFLTKLNNKNKYFRQAHIKNKQVKAKYECIYYTFAPRHCVIESRVFL